MTAWRKSSYSAYNGNCVEVAVATDPAARAEAWVRQHHGLAKGNPYRRLYAEAFLAGYAAALACHRGTVAAALADAIEHRGHGGCKECAAALPCETADESAARIAAYREVLAALADVKAAPAARS